MLWIGKIFYVSDNLKIAENESPALFSMRVAHASSTYTFGSHVRGSEKMPMTNVTQTILLTFEHNIGFYIAFVFVFIYLFFLFLFSICLFKYCRFSACQSAREHVRTRYCRPPNRGATVWTNRNGKRRVGMVSCDSRGPVQFHNIKTNTSAASTHTRIA